VRNLTTPKKVAGIMAAAVAALTVAVGAEPASAEVRYSDGAFASASLTVVPYGSVARDVRIVMESSVTFSFRIYAYDPATRTGSWSNWRSAYGFAIIPIVSEGQARWWRHAVQYARPGFASVTEWMTIRHCSFGFCQTRRDGWARY
jgi:hypothetical protein